MSWAMKVGGSIAITTERTMKKMTSTRRHRSCFFSFMSFMKDPLRKSSVIVEEDVKTSEDSVDIEALMTRTTRTPIRMSGSFERSCGMTVS